MGRGTTDLVLVGGPGSGKGTQAERLCSALGLPHVSTGDLFRENAAAGTDLGRLANAYMDRGDLVPDDVTEAMVRERLARPDAADGFVLDGFPRNRAQAEALDDLLADADRRVTGVLDIVVPDEEIVRRLSGRLICRNCQTPYHDQSNPPSEPGVCDNCGGELYRRDDDNPDTVRARLRTFHAHNAALLDHYSGRVRTVDGTGPVDQVAGRVLGAATYRTTST